MIRGRLFCALRKSIILRRLERSRLGVAIFLVCTRFYERYLAHGVRPGTIDPRRWVVSCKSIIPGHLSFHQQCKSIIPSRLVSAHSMRPEARRRNTGPPVSGGCVRPKDATAHCEIPTRKTDAWGTHQNTGTNISSASETGVYLFYREGQTIRLRAETCGEIPCFRQERFELRESGAVP